MDLFLFFSFFFSALSRNRSFDDISVHRPDMTHLTGPDSPYIMIPNTPKRIFLGTPPFKCISPLRVAAGNLTPVVATPFLTPSLKSRSEKATHWLGHPFPHCDPFLVPYLQIFGCFWLGVGLRFFAKIGPPSPGPDTDRVGTSTTIRSRLSA